MVRRAKISEPTICVSTWLLQDVRYVFELVARRSHIREMQLCASGRLGNLSDSLKHLKSWSHPMIRPKMHVVLNNSHINMFPRKVAINAYVDLAKGYVNNQVIKYLI